MLLLRTLFSSKNTENNKIKRITVSTKMLCRTTVFNIDKIIRFIF